MTDFIITKEQMCAKYGCTMEKLNSHLLSNAKSFEKMYNKAIATGKKVNGFTAIQLKDYTDKYYKLCEC